jgi:hypoxanthine phosphoribosyltransferase
MCNLLRGAGLDGLAGMASGLRHPILGLRRSETHELCACLGLDPVQDPSNLDPRHLRNRVRRELLPLCAEIAQRDPVPVLARQAVLLRDDAAFLDRQVADALPDPRDARALRSAPVPLARRAIRRWLAPTDPESEHHPPSGAEVARVLEVASGARRATELAGGRRVRRSSGHLALEGDSGKVRAVKTEPAVSPIPAWGRNEVGEPVVTAEAIANRVAELGAAITADYAGNPPLLVGVLKGAMMFMSDLARAIELPVDVDFMAVSSYGSATRTSGVVRIVKDLDTDLVGRHVLVVEDIIDSGLTLNYLRRYLQARDPASLEVCALLVKAGEQRVPLKLRYVGFTIPSSFVVGYGLDADERYRNLRAVHLYQPAGEEA